jgi:hypothetical protein
MNIEQISQSWQNIAPLLIPIFSEEDCDRREAQLKKLVKLNQQEKDKYLMEKPVYTEPYAMPLTIYREAAKFSKFLIESEQNMTSKVEDFFFKDDISNRIIKNLGVTTFPLSQMSLQFIDQILIRSIGFC